MINELEAVSENIEREIDDINQLILDSQMKRDYRSKFNSCISNLRTYNNNLYCYMEDMDVNETSMEDLKYEISVLKEVLRYHISYEDTIYLRLKYNIKIDE